MLHFAKQISTLADHEAKRFSEEQIVGVLKEAEAGAKTKALCRRRGIAEVLLRTTRCLELPAVVCQCIGQIDRDVVHVSLALPKGDREGIWPRLGAGPGTKRFNRQRSQPS